MAINSTTPKVQLSADALAALESITVGGEVEIGATSLSALESITIADGGGSLTVDGSVSVSNFPAAQPVTDNAGSLTVDGTFWQATQPVSGPLTDAQLRATAVPVSGTVTVSGAGTQYAEDSAHVNADLGNLVLGVRKDTRGTNVGTDGDYAPFQVNASGDIRVDASAVAVPVTDNGGSLTVDGTFFQATQPISGEVSLDATTLAALESITVVDGGGSLTVDAASLPLPTGASTLAEQQTQTTALQLIDDIVRSEDEASGDGHKGAVVLGVRKASPANTSGTDGDYEALQMSAGRVWTSTTIDAALPAGTAAIGKLAANDGVDIGDVTINNSTGAAAVNIQDGGNTITVDGTVEIGATSLAALETIELGATTLAALESITVVDGGSTISVDDGGTILSVDDGAGSLTVDNGGTFAVQATLAAGATTIAKAEDVGSADADVGVPAMAIRKGTPANTSGTDGDYEMLQMSAGRLWTSAVIDTALPAGSAAIGKLAANDGVDIGDVTINNGSGGSAVNVQDGGNTLTVDNGGTFATQDSQVIADNGGFTDGTSKVFPAGFIFDETAGTGLTENDVAAPRVDSKRAVVSVIEDETTRGRRVTVTAANAMKVDASGVAVPITDNAGSLTVDQGTAANLNAQVVGVVATDAPVSGNPLLDGGRASTAFPTAVSGDGDLVPFWLDRQGALFIRPRELVTYVATFRLAVASSALSLTFTPSANTDKQLLTLYHAVGATKTVRISRIALLLSVGALGVYGFEVRRLSGATAPSGGNPAITPVQASSASGSAELTCLSLPTTQGTETGVNLPLTPHLEFNGGATAAETNPTGFNNREYLIYAHNALDDREPLTIRAGVAEGLALIGRGTTTAPIKWTASVEFTET